MQSLFFRLIEDGKRTVLILEGASHKQKEALYLSLMSLCGLEPPTSGEDAVHRLKSEGLENVSYDGIAAMPNGEELANMTDYAVSRHWNKTRITGGTYAGMTATEALSQKREEALVDLFYYARQIDLGQERDEIIKACQMYLMDMTDENDIYHTRAEREQFLHTMSKIQNPREIINGYQDISEFCQYASDKDFNFAYATFRKALRTRGRGFEERPEE